MEEWTNERMLSFLEFYQSEAVLWDPTHVEHKDKKKKHGAWLRISELMECPIHELKRKKDSLMATFRGHLRKKKAAIRSGAGVSDIYKPVWFAYEFMESFLGPIYNCNATMNLQTKPESNEDPDDPPFKPQIPELQTITSSAVTQSIHRCCQNPPELHETGKQMREAFKVLNSVVARRACDEEDDECDLYGKMLAKKLRKLPENERELLMYDIDGLFLRRHHNLSSSTFASTTIQHRPLSSAMSSYSPDSPLTSLTP